MALNIDTSAGISKQASLFASPNNGIVSDSELTNVAKQILSATPAKVNLPQGNYLGSRNINNVDVKFYEAGYDINAVKQAATNRTGFDVNLSQNALNSINALKAQAAQIQAMNLTKAVDGKIHVNAEKPDSADLKSTMSNFNTNVEVFQAANADKDKKGPGGFYLPQENSEEEKEEGLNLII